MRLQGNDPARARSVRPRCPGSGQRRRPVTAAVCPRARLGSLGGLWAERPRKWADESCLYEARPLPERPASAANSSGSGHFSRRHDPSSGAGRGSRERRSGSGHISRRHDPLHVRVARERSEQEREVAAPWREALPLLGREGGAAVESREWPPRGARCCHPCADALRRAGSRPAGWRRPPGLAREAGCRLRCTRETSEHPAGGARTRNGALVPVTRWMKRASIPPEGLGPVRGVTP